MIVCKEALMDQKKLEAAVMEAAMTLEAWYNGNLDDRVALRMLRARMLPLAEQVQAHLESGRGREKR